MDAKRVVAVAIASSLGAVAGYSHAATDAASATVYKCKQANGGVLYQDYPCKNGVVVDVKPDAADPAAIARLERAQALYERDAARRRADEASEERRAAFERMQAMGLVNDHVEGCCVRDAAETARAAFERPHTHG